MNREIELKVSDLIMDAAISKAIEDKRHLLIPSIDHFLDGGKVNGEFDLALKKLMQWVENKTLEGVREHAREMSIGFYWFANTDTKALEYQRRNRIDPKMDGSHIPKQEAQINALYDKYLDHLNSIKGE